MSKKEIAPVAGPRTQRVDLGDGNTVELGQWYWVKADPMDENTGRRRGRRKSRPKEEWLACVMEIGSNFVELHGPKFGSSYWDIRVHFEDFEAECRFEPNAEIHIAERIAYYKRQIGDLIGKVQSETERLGVVPTQIAGTVAGGDRALAVLSEQVDTNAYKIALIKAKEKTLPALFEEIETANKWLAGWMTAPTLPTLAQIGPMKESIGQIEDRIYTIELYAGLAEEAVQCCGGTPAATGEKLRIMQRRLYMDEECLLSYEAGGLEFKEIGEFDAWISRQENRDRLLPFPRTLAAFRVRRHSKERDHGGNLLSAWINFQLEQADKYTYLYVRNGDQVWRVVCDFEFDEMIIPRREDFDPSEPMMVKMFAGSVDKLMSVREYEVRCLSDKERAAKYEEWEAANPKAHYFDNPYRRDSSFEPEQWAPFDHSNVYFDEAMEFVQAEIKRYNRIAVIIQGLFDRSLVLHPHPRVHLWDAQSFDAAIEVIYDAETLTYRDPPDFEKYRAQLNRTLGPGSITVGQQDFWLRAEAVKEGKRRDRDWRDTSHYRPERFHPHGDPGPGDVAKIAGWSARTKTATFRWARESRDWRRDSQEPINSKVTVPIGDLLNVSAYEPGDFRQFFTDPRTRADYLKWAPLMLTAEDYHAGKIEVSDPTDPRPHRRRRRRR